MSQPPRRQVACERAIAAPRAPTLTHSVRGSPPHQRATQSSCRHTGEPEHPRMSDRATTIAVKFPGLSFHLHPPNSEGVCRINAQTVAVQPHCTRARRRRAGPYAHRCREVSRPVLNLPMPPCNRDPPASTRRPVRVQVHRREVSPPLAVLHAPCRREVSRRGVLRCAPTHPWECTYQCDALPRQRRHIPACILAPTGRGCRRRRAALSNHGAASSANVTRHPSNSRRRSSDIPLRT